MQIKHTSKPAHYNHNGFTLIEVLIVVAILGILSAIAYPSYVEYVRRGKRVEAQGKLQQAAQWMQRYYSTNDQYVGADTKLPANLKRSPDNGTEAYTITVVPVADPPSYTLTATAKNSMAKDKCGNLTLNSYGEKKSSKGTVADCWK